MPTFDNAVGGALLANFYSAGEVCSNGTRVFVHRRIRSAFLERLKARAAAMRVGDPMEPDYAGGALDLGIATWKRCSATSPAAGPRARTAGRRLSRDHR